jgi:putative ABC transport system permease protein
VNTHPPRWVTRLLEGVVPPTARGRSILGDLHEEFSHRASKNVWRARLWYVRTGLGVFVRYVGQSRKDARRPSGLALRQIGSWEGFVDALVLNLRYAVRRLRKSPMFTFVAVLSLGLGIGANTAMFSLVNAVIIRDTPYENPESLVDVYERMEGFSHGTLSYPDYVDFLAGSKDVFEDVAGSQLTLLQVDSDAGVEMLPAESVTGNYFSLLGIQPAVGRLFSNEDHVAPGAHPVVVLGHGYWQRQFAADPNAVGEEIRLAGRSYTVIGVVHEDYQGNLRGIVPEAYVPIMMFDELQGNSVNTLEARGNQSFFAKGRLRDGATFAQAEAVASRIGDDIRAENPTYWQAEKAFALVPTSDVIMNPMIDKVIVPAAGMIMVVVGLVLLIACANLASFLLARAADRRKEIAVRLAMGAKRRTLIGQLLTETVLLSLLGGIAGVVLASWSLNALVAADLPLPLPITLDLSLDQTVLVFSIMVSVAAGLLFGLVPALQSTNPDVAPTLRDESAGGGRAKSAALRNLLVVGQVSVSMVLLVGAGLFLRSLDASRSVDPGFGTSPTGLLQINASAARYSDEEALIYFEDLKAQIAQLPGVQSVGYIDNLHLNTLSTQNVRVMVDGVEPPAGADYHNVDYGRIDHDFLEAAEIALLEGRNFNASDVADGEPVAIVSEAFARRFFPAGEAVGKSIRVNDDETLIVGVTKDTKVRQLGETPRPYVYRSHNQYPPSYVVFAARTTTDAGQTALEMMSLARSLDPEIMVIETKTMERHLAVMLLPRQLGAIVVAGFAFLALILASIGLYGVVSYAVSRRAKEVGIRISLGAEPGSVVWMLTTGGLKLVAVGGVLGLMAAAALSQLLSRLLYGVPPLDLLTFSVVPAVFTVVAFAASWIPARRVTSIDPVGALRSE